MIIPSFRHVYVRFGLIAIALLVICLSLRRSVSVSSELPVPGADPGAHQNARALCGKHGWPVFVSSVERPRRVYDLFLLNSELDWLEIRLNELSDEVDYFVIVESNTTFSGYPKELYLDRPSVWPSLAPLHPKIIRHIVDYSSHRGNFSRAWDREAFQRNAMLTQALLPLAADAAHPDPRAPAPGDVLLVSDLDEIPRPETVRTLRKCAFPPKLTLRAAFYYYSFQFMHHGSDWEHPQATFFQGSRTVLPQDLRRSVKSHFRFLPSWGSMSNASWHCSSCFSTIHEMQTKIQSFSHVAYNHPWFLWPDNIVQRVRTGSDLFDRPTETYDHIPENRDVPTYLKNNRGRFSYILNRDPPNANFKDYNPEQF